MGEEDERLRPPVTVEIRDAATIIVVRDPRTAPAILMGQRGSGAIFMPNKFVFPGGAVDPSDADVVLARPLPKACHDKLAIDANGTVPNALAAAAIRELHEESGQLLGAPGSAPPWSGWTTDGFGPDASRLRFFLRAITPPGRTRRYDARFFLVDAAHLMSDHDDFHAADEELRHLRWVLLDEAQGLDLAFITRIVLSELARHLPRMDAPDRVPVIRNDDPSGGLTWV